ncbi:hypothetical protein GIB67_016160, partial [Kingdonia uniflora]
TAKVVRTVSKLARTTLRLIGLKPYKLAQSFEQNLNSFERNLALGQISSGTNFVVRTTLGSWAKFYIGGIWSFERLSTSFEQLWIISKLP